LLAIEIRIGKPPRLLEELDGARGVAGPVKVDSEAASKPNRISTAPTKRLLREERLEDRHAGGMIADAGADLARGLGVLETSSRARSRAHGLAQELGAPLETRASCKLARSFVDDRPRGAVIATGDEVTREGFPIAHRARGLFEKVVRGRAVKRPSSPRRHARAPQRLELRVAHRIDPSPLIDRRADQLLLLERAQRPCDGALSRSKRRRDLPPRGDSEERDHLEHATNRRGERLGVEIRVRCRAWDFRSRGDLAESAVAFSDRSRDLPQAARVAAGVARTRPENRVARLERPQKRSEKLDRSPQRQRS